MRDLDYAEALPIGADFGGGRLDTSDPYTRLYQKDDDQEGKKPYAPHDLDSIASTVQHGMLLGMYEQELDRQAENRTEMAIDEDFYDNIQWSDAEAQELRERGQDPLVYNVISASVNWVIGTEKRGRTDYKILPRRKESSKPAEKKSQLMKYLSDVNMTPFHKSRAFEDATKVGIGWIETGYNSDGDGEPIYERYESWRNLLWDSAATEKDLSDARYMFRTKWVDLDVAIAMIPGREGILRSAAGDIDRFGLDRMGDDAMDSSEMARELNTSTRSNYGGFGRQRVRLVEAWIRTPIKVKKLKQGASGEFDGAIYDEYSPVHAELVSENKAVIVERQMMRMHVAIFCTTGILWAGESPYRHNGFPFTPIWCYRRGRDGMPYGMIRGMRGPQTDVNKRASKALHILSTNKTLMEEGAVDDLDEYLEEVSRPDAVLVYKAGKKIELAVDRDLAPAHLQLMSQSIQLIQSASGVTDENLGRQTNAVSGLAIGRRQEQGAMATAGIFDNLRFADQVRGSKLLSLLEQYMDQEKQFRITNQRGMPEYITVNDGLPENDIVRSKADYVISDEDWRATWRQAATDSLIEVMTKLAPGAPQLVGAMIDLVVESMDIPNREEIVKRIRAVTGMKDPDQTEPTPEDIQREQAQAQQAQFQQQMAQAQLQGAQADAAKKQADAEKAMAGAKQLLASIAGDNVETQAAALQAALVMIGAPGSAQVADVVLHEAGFQGRTEQEQIARQQIIAQAQQQQAQQQLAPPPAVGQPQPGQM